MKNKKLALLRSVIALLLCVSMFVGTTFAWFTDSVTSGNNRIVAGNLDIGLEYYDAETGAWTPVLENTNVFAENTLWEPGHTEVVYLKVSNLGSLALKYQLGINIAAETGSVNKDGDSFLLSDYIEFAAIEGVETPYGSREEARAAVTSSAILSTGYTKRGSMEPGCAPHYVALVVFMPESVGNEANYATGANRPEITLGIDLLATQLPNEDDSFNNQYDSNAEAEIFPGFQGGMAGAVVTADDQGLTTSEVAMDGGDVSAVVPAGVQVAEGTGSLTLSVNLKDASDANIQLGENDEMRPLDVHIEGVAEDNTVAMLVTLKHYLTTGLNTGALKLYHVENGKTVAMTQVAEPKNHNEFSYDPATGDLTLALASFSEVAVVADTTNTWDGKTQVFVKNDDGTYSIHNASQLAYFRNEVDGGNTFEGKIVKLENNIYLSNVNFDPIGWGYENKDWNVGDQPGKPFKGTFDGNGKTIFDLYQSGWDLTNAGTGEAYTYTNCGFGLFAAAADATFKNLTIYGANIRVECVETGILVGLSQGSCTYENINIHNSKIANYQRPTGGLIGEISPLNGGGETKITNVVIGSDVVVGSLWGDFDAPCGGVIGARWDSSDTTTVNMKNVTVGCRMDVYSDVTSAYQWYAYRRAGMLIGNTEQTKENDPHRADARFLTCDNVKVYYGNWAAYHYCQFTNQDNTWANNYPWVRVEAGENCSAYSNPRYGQPVINGVKVTTDTHTCSNDNHMTELRFNQLYGGGQGVYGQFEHDGVEVINYQYSITYVNDYQVLAIRYINADEAQKEIETKYDPAWDLVKTWADDNIGAGKYAYGGWMNAGSTKVEKIEANNTKDIVLYPYFNNPYTARFVDQQGNVIAYCLFHKEDTTKLGATKAAAEAALPNLGEDLEFDYWQVQKIDDNGKVLEKKEYKDFDFANCERDVTIYPVYLYKGDVNLIPVDSDSDGIINYYQVGGYSDPNGQAMVEIPASVNGIPILEINKNAFSSYDGVHSVVIPADVTYIGDNALAEKWGTADSGETVTIYYEGSYADWVEKEKAFGSSWDSGISASSRIFFLNGGKTVDISQGYLQAKVSGYTSSSKSVSWDKATITAAIVTEYTGHCDCSISTTGDTAHIYVRVNADGTETTMLHNSEGTPVNEQGVEIYWGTIKEGFLGFGKEEGLRDNDTSDTYKRYRPDAIYWAGVTVN